MALIAISAWFSKPIPTKKMEYERFKKIWDECSKEHHAKGELFIDDWTAMCEKLEEMSEELSLPAMPEDGDMITDPSHRAFIEGAKWGFKLACEKNSENNRI